jgi:tRNA 2-thiouridine synthesizing protein A
MPVIRLQDAIMKLPIGSSVEITCTDPGVKIDIPAWCKINGHRVDRILEQGHEIIISVSKQIDD